MAEFTKENLLTFPKVYTDYQDNEGRDVCGSCGSYYEVTPERLAKAQEVMRDMYEALKESRNMLITIAKLNYVADTDSDYEILQRHIAKALAKADGK